MGRKTDSSARANFKGFIDFHVEHENQLGFVFVLPQAEPPPRSDPNPLSQVPFLQRRFLDP
jgi:hypothetical protein